MPSHDSAKPAAGSDIEARLQQAVALHLSGRMAEAQAQYLQVLAAVPEHAQALNLLGASYVQQGRLSAAEERLRRALEIDPDYADAHYNLGCALRALGRMSESAASFAAALACAPEHDGARLNLANALQAQGRHEAAAAAYAALLARKPDDADAHNNLGNSLLELGQYEQACEHFEAALRARPGYAEALNNLGLALLALKRYEAAATRLREAIARAPGLALAHANLAQTLTALDRPDEAIAHCQAALAADPQHAQACNNWGVALQAQNRHEEALACYERALAIQPEHADAQWNKALALLALGRYAQGWRGYEARWRRKHTPPLPHTDLPLWERNRERGWVARLLGRAPEILLQSEQGYGDTLQMLRYLPVLERAGVRCALQVPETLAALLKRSFPRVRVLAPDERPRGVSARLPLLSLPLACESFSEAAIPSQVPYLAADEDRVARWRTVLARAPGLKLGVAWRGRPTHDNDARRSLALAQLLPLFALRDIHYFSLQLAPSVAERDLLDQHANVTALDRELASFDDTAAIVSALDLVVSVDTSLAHLAGALARPLWVMLPFSADWRWQRTRRDSPWYPSAELFRQTRPGDWSGVIAQIAERLRTF